MAQVTLLSSSRHGGGGDGGGGDRFAYVIEVEVEAQHFCAMPLRELARVGACDLATDEGEDTFFVVAQVSV